MTDDNRFTWGLIFDVLDVLDRHGYHSAGHQHTGQAVLVIYDLTRGYEGTHEASATAHPVPPQPAHQDAGEPPDWPARQDPVTISSAELGTILAALDEAADVKHDRAANCADCADRSCGTCEFRLRAARAYESAAARLLAAEQAGKPGTPDHQPSPASPPHPSVHHQVSLEAEAGR